MLLLYRDPNTLFRGNTLASKLVDSLMKLVGIPYLHDTIKGVIDLVSLVSANTYKSAPAGCMVKELAVNHEVG